LAAASCITVLSAFDGLSTFAEDVEGAIGLVEPVQVADPELHVAPTGRVLRRPPAVGAQDAVVVAVGVRHGVHSPLRRRCGATEIWPRWSP